MKPGANMGGRPRADRFKEIAKDLPENCAGKTLDLITAKRRAARNRSREEREGGRIIVPLPDDAIRLYQRDGWEWCGFHRDAVTDARPLKPELPETGNHGIPIKHEIEFEYPL